MMLDKESFKYCKIDPETATYGEIKAEIERLSKLKHDLSNEEQGIKIFINSVYGAFGNQHFLCYNINVAEAITLQSVDISLHAKKIFDNYFSNHWHKDKKLHKLLNIKTEIVEPIGKETLLIQGDTDSAYFRFDKVLQSAKYSGDTPVNFILDIYKYRLHSYIVNAYEMYATKRNTLNLMDFEFEKLIRIGLFIAKKNYAIELAWKTTAIKVDNQGYANIEGIQYSDGKLSVTGLEAVKPSHPSWCREKLQEMLNLILASQKKNGNIRFEEIVNVLKKWRKEMEMRDLDEISETKKISDYDKFILNDVSEIAVKSGCPMHVRGAAIYNYTLSRSKFKMKYHRVKSGDKVKLYYTKTNSKKDDVFCYLPQNHPREFAPLIDYDKQFAKKIIEPTNRLLGVMGIKSIPETLIVTNALF
jgi:DNA polymerase elongation subunit (family B)